MLGFVSRLRRKLDDRSWIPIGEDYHTETPAFARPVTTARVDGPPDFALPNPPESLQTPPPSYAQIRDTSRPEIAILLVGNRASYGSPRSPTNATPRRSLQPLVGSTLTSLEDIRHAQAINHVPMDNRLSSVPNYPVFENVCLENPPTSRRRRSRRPASIASTTSTGLFLSMGQLPGSEPFDRQASRAALARSNWQQSQGVVSPVFSPDSAISTAQTARAGLVTVQQLPSVEPNMRPPRGTNELSLHASDMPFNSVTPPVEGFYAPGVQPQPPLHPVIKQSRTWPAHRQSANMDYPDDGARVRFADVHSHLPPPPPPKDPGYVSRPPGGVQRGKNVLRQTQASPKLLPGDGSRRESHEGSTRNHHRDSSRKNTHDGKTDSPRLSVEGGTFPNRRFHVMNALGRLLSSRSVRPVVAT